MISRRLLRRKVLHILYAFGQKEDDTLASSEKELMFSIHKSYDLYHYFFLLIIDVFRYAELKIDFGRNKNITTYDDLHPNTRFIENKVYQQLVANEPLKSYLHNQKLSWVNDADLIKHLFLAFKESLVYERYMAKSSTTYLEDVELVVALVSDVFAVSEDLLGNLEEKSIYWNDDAEFMLGMVIRTIQSFREKDPGGGKLLPLFRNDEDLDFVKQLNRKVILGKKEFDELVHTFASNWEIERIAYMDVLIIDMAIAEVINFPGIPVKVTLNEYIELAKEYSTDKSSIFINGVLDKIVAHLRDENKFRKVGRGLME